MERVGLSNADTDQIRAGTDILGTALVSVQNEWSPLVRGSRSEIALCEQLGLAFLSYGPPGGMREAKELGSASVAFAEVAAERDVSPQRVAVAWALATSPCMLPIPGASRPESVLDSVQAVGLALTVDEMARLNAPSPT